MTKSPRRTGLPSSWAEVHDRLSYALGGDPESADEWISQAIEAMWSTRDLMGLPRAKRGLALQKASGVLLALEDVGYDLAFDMEIRDRIRGLIARYFNGVAVDGPPWRVTPFEDRPTHDDYIAAADFGAA